MDPDGLRDVHPYIIVTPKTSETDQDYIEIDQDPLEYLGPIKWSEEELSEAGSAFTLQSTTSTATQPEAIEEYGEAADDDMEVGEIGGEEEEMANPGAALTPHEMIRHALNDQVEDVAYRDFGQWRSRDWKDRVRAWKETAERHRRQLSEE